MWLLEQNSFSPSSWFCRPWNVSENKIRSSAHSKWAIISLLIHIPWAVDRYVSRSDIYFLNNNPLATPPWLTPSLLRIIELTRPLFFMRNDVLLYRFRNVSMTGPCQPLFIILQNRIWRFMRSNALEKSTKHTTRFDPMHSCLLTRPCRMKILSYHAHQSYRFFYGTSKVM